MASTGEGAHRLLVKGLVVHEVPVAAGHVAAWSVEVEDGKTIDVALYSRVSGVHKPGDGDILVELAQGDIVILHCH